MTTKQWKKEQAEDETIGEVIKTITAGADTHAFASEKLNSYISIEVS